MELSYRQKAVEDAWLNKDHNILINAVAGSGKTSTLMHLMKRSKKKTLFLAFNKSIQMEIEQRIFNAKISTARAFTLHSLGFASIRRNAVFEMKHGKSYELARAVEKSAPHLLQGLIFKERLLITATLKTFNEISRNFLTDDFNEIRIYNRKQQGPYWNDARMELLWEEYLKLREEQYEEDVIPIDFTDMIYLPIRNGWRIPTSPRHLMIDEAQDLNLCQHKMIERILEQGAVEKFIAVGDPNQSIYGFTGAYASSFEKFLDYGNTIEFPLDICYRCPTKVLEQANEVYDVMQGFKKEPGVVGKLKETDIAKIKDGALVICRNTGPIILLYMYLLGLERKVFIKGDDVMGQLNKFMVPYRRDQIFLAHSKMHSEHKRLEENANYTDEPRDKWEAEQYGEMLDCFAILRKFYGSKVRTVGQLIEVIGSIFKEDDNSSRVRKKGITLCTIHKSKGLESKYVYILNEYYIPSKFARSDDQLKQEQNLKYVARSRASEELYYLDAEMKELIDQDPPDESERIIHTVDEGL